MIVPFVFVALLFAAGAGMLIALGTLSKDSGRLPVGKKAHLVAVVYILLALLFAFGPLARAADVAEIPSVAVFTDEQDECPRLWRMARSPDRRTLGCWTIGEVDRRITIRWDDGRVASYSEMQFEIYANTP